MRKMGGLKKFMPVTHLTMAVGWLAICGFPFLSGFFSKDEILYQTFTTGVFGQTVFGKLFWFVGAATAVLTAVYMTRLMVLTFWTKERWHDGDGHDDHGHDAHAGGAHGHHGLAKGETPRESPVSMTLPLIVLAIGAALGGYLGVPNGLGHAIGIENSNVFEHFLEPSLAHAGGHAAEAAVSAEAAHSATTEFGLMGVSIALALIGIGIGFAVFRKSPLLRMPRLLEDKWRVDELYEATIIHPIRRLSEGVLWKIVDVRIIDFAVNGVAGGIRGLGASMRYLQSGLARSYVAVILLGAACLVGYFLIQGYVK